MLLPRSFVLGLLAYMRQAALSLHRAPGSFCEGMREYYELHRIPMPSRVATRLDILQKQDASNATGLGQRLLARAFGKSIHLGAGDVRVLREALRDLDAVLEVHVMQSDAERVRIRMNLSKTEELLRRRLGRRSAALAEKVAHLNETSGLGLRSLQEIAGSNWPETDAG